ncbi:MAG: YccF domain-containing protein [Actinomycetaceae bacterium]|nr:YccF domain-containing protein [Actinomycetaceae bacterium]
MRTILNIIWLIFAGIELALLYVLFGLLAIIPIVTIPAAVASFRMALYVLWPFGRKVVDKPGAGVGSALMNVVWFLIAGLWLAIGHIATAAALAVTIIGIPMAIANLKLIPVTCFPFGKQIVASDGYEGVLA